MLETTNMDVLSLIIELYFAPVITSHEKENKFYLTITYPTNAIALQLPPTDYVTGKSWSRHYKTEDVEKFIQCLVDGIDGSLWLQGNDNKVTLSAKGQCIRISWDGAESHKVCLRNTDQCRKSFIDIMWKYYEFMDSYDYEFF